MATVDSEDIRKRPNLGPRLVVSVLVALAAVIVWLGVSMAQVHGDPSISELRRMAFRNKSFHRYSEEFRRTYVGEDLYFNLPPAQVRAKFVQLFRDRGWTVASRDDWVAAHDHNIGGTTFVMWRGIRDRPIMEEPRATCRVFVSYDTSPVDKLYDQVMRW